MGVSGGDEALLEAADDGVVAAGGEAVLEKGSVPFLFRGKGLSVEKGSVPFFPLEFFCDGLTEFRNAGAGDVLGVARVERGVHGGDDVRRRCEVGLSAHQGHNVVHRHGPLEDLANPRAGHGRGLARKGLHDESSVDVEFAWMRSCRVGTRSPARNSETKGILATYCSAIP